MREQHYEDSLITDNNFILAPFICRTSNFSPHLINNRNTLLQKNSVWPLKGPLVLMKRSTCLTSEAVQSAALPLQSVHHIHCGHGLPLGVLGVGDGITDHVLQEHLEHTAGLLVDQTGDTLHSTAASQTADSGLGDSLDVITEDFTVTLCASFAESFTSLTSTAHYH